MGIRVEEITCKSALTGSGGRFRLNPYCGCEHACVYCYATYLTRWRGQSGPWGSWVQVKTNVPQVLERELARRKVDHVMLSTACDVYQQVEEHYRLTRQCLSALAIASQKLDGPGVFVLTKSDRILRDLDVLRVFPDGKFGMAFSMTTHRDDVAAILRARRQPALGAHRGGEGPGRRGHPGRAAHQPGAPLHHRARYARTARGSRSGRLRRRGLR